jgi:hypothetical protein
MPMVARPSCDGSEDVMTTGLLVVRALADLLYIDFLAALGGFAGIERVVKKTPVRDKAPDLAAVTAVTNVVLNALTLYIRPVPCLRRSAVVTRLLRRQGVPAQLVIGCHLSPLRAHAWVEVGGQIISDNQAYLSYYCVLDRW